MSVDHAITVQLFSMQDGAPASEATPMETEQKDGEPAAAPAPAPAAAPTPAAPQEVEEVVKKKRTRKTNVNFTAQTAGMQTEQLSVRVSRVD